MSSPFLELPIRLAWFLLVFVLLAFWESKSELAPLTQDKKARWMGHLGLSFAGSVIIRTFVPLTSMAAAWFASYHRIGLFNLVSVPFILSAALTTLNLDWALYYGHRTLHAFPRLWKLHRVHHTDLDFDVSTGARFHFLETAFALGVRTLVILILGCPPGAVVLFEVIYGSAVLFNHANIRLQPGVEKLLRVFWVTPQMHRVHHSIRRRETNRNFGFIFSWWDRVFGTYLEKPEGGLEAVTLGLESFRDPIQTALPNLLLQPFMDEEQGISMGNFKSKETAYTQGK